jgi:hypothetical protein
VGGDAVFAQPLAVIAGDDDGGPVVDAQFLQGGDHPAHVAIGELHLAVVEVGLGFAEGRELGVALVVQVRVVKVQREEELLVLVRPEKVDAVIGHLAGR